MSSTTVNKANGEPITFNFKLENGLPVKPIISPAYSTGFSDKKKSYVLAMYLTDNELKQLDDLEIETFAYFKEQKEIWLTIHNNINDKIIGAIEQKNLIICFFKKDKTFIHGIKIK